MKTGDICWIEIRTRDIAGAKDFFEKVFDWNYQPVSTHAPILMIDTGCAPGGGIIQLPEEVPLSVCPYALVEDCVATAKRVAELGGRVCMENETAGEMGSFSICLDPWGNEMGFWQPAMQGSPPFQGPGKNPFSWVEVYVEDIAAGIEYYGKLLGWEFIREGDGPYAFTPHGEEAGGAIGVGMSQGKPEFIDAHSTSYVTVEDVGAARARIEAAGGKHLYGPHEIPHTGTIAYFATPEGTRMALFQPAERS